MAKKMIKLILFSLIILGATIAVTNTPVDLDAVMVEEQLHAVPGGTMYLCKGAGQGCYTVSPDPTPN